MAVYSSCAVCGLPPARPPPAGSYTRTPPAGLAVYIAVSAQRSRPCTSWACSGKAPIPMLPLIRSVAAPTPNGSRSRRSTPDATRFASLTPMPCSSTANSSPPSRATVSVLRTWSDSRRPTCTSSWSPTWWPSESLTSLNRSRSISSTAQGARSAAVAAVTRR